MVRCFIKIEIANRVIIQSNFFNSFPGEESLRAPKITVVLFIKNLNFLTQFMNMNIRCYFYKK